MWGRGLQPASRLLATPIVTDWHRKYLLCRAKCSAFAARRRVLEQDAKLRRSVGPVQIRRVSIISSARATEVSNHNRLGASVAITEGT